MPAGFDAARHVTKFYAAFARVKELVADFRADEKFYSPQHIAAMACRVRLKAFLRRPSRDAVLRATLREADSPLRSLTPAEIKIVEGAAT
jgi:hypothetical protein